MFYNDWLTKFKLKKPILIKFIYTFIVLFCSIIVNANLSHAEPSHAISMHGEPALPSDFPHFRYVNPEAPKKGSINYAWTGTFDSINPFIVQGTAARGIMDTLFGNLVFDSLMMRASDEPFTLYPLLAKTVETNDNRDFVEFTLDERAKFSDGEPVKPEDFIFTIELLKEKGWPRYATIANKIEKIEKIGSHGIKITFKKPDRELPLILANMIVLPKHAINPKTFEKSSLKPIIGSGPYIVETVQAGESINFKRNPNYWAANIPSMKGMHNYERIKLTYYRDENAMFESFRKGLTDVFFDENSRRWKTQYNFPSVKQGKVIQEKFISGMPSGMYGIVMNTRKEIFNDIAFRRALAKVFDFEWTNRNLLDSSCKRITSFFGNSDLSSYNRPAGEEEKNLLKSFPNLVSEEIMEHGWNPGTSDGSGHDRAFLESRIHDFREAGYTIKNGKMSNTKSKPIKFELMLKSREEEKIALAWKQTLEKLGIQLDIRLVDSTQFQQRLTNYDYDSFIMNYPSSLSPGIEQIGRWGSSTRDKSGTFNFAGASHPAIDFLIDRMLTARTHEDLINAVRAYDRVLLSQAYVVPLYFHPEQWVARWKTIKRPETIDFKGIKLPAWWHE